MLNSLSIIHLPSVGITLDRRIYQAVSDYLEYAERLLSSFPTASETTDLKVAFPFLAGMTEEQWEEYTPVTFCQKAKNSNPGSIFLVEWERQVNGTADSAPARIGFWTWGATFDEALAAAIHKCPPASNAIEHSAGSDLLSALKALFNPATRSASRSEA